MYFGVTHVLALEDRADILWTGGKHIWSGLIEGPFWADIYFVADQYVQVTIDLILHKITDLSACNNADQTLLERNRILN
jgi:hypothetical protein